MIRMWRGVSDPCNRALKETAGFTWVRLCAIQRAQENCNGKCKKNKKINKVKVNCENCKCKPCRDRNDMLSRKLVSLFNKRTSFHNKEPVP